jgi:hypothetical protein
MGGVKKKKTSFLHYQNNFNLQEIFMADKKDLEAVLTKHLSTLDLQ